MIDFIVEFIGDFIGEIGSKWVYTIASKFKRKSKKSK